MATVPSPEQCLALPPSLTEMHGQPRAELMALAYPSEDFVAEYKEVLKASGRSPWNLLSPSVFRDSEFPSRDGQSAPHTMGHMTLPGSTALLWLRSKCIILEMPFLTSTRELADKEQ